MNWIKQNWFKIIIMILAAFGFYWFSLRLEMIDRNCYKDVREDLKNEEYNIETSAEYNTTIGICKARRIFY